MFGVWYTIVKVINIIIIIIIMLLWWWCDWVSVVGIRTGTIVASTTDERHVPDYHTLRLSTDCTHSHLSGNLQVSLASS